MKLEPKFTTKVRPFESMENIIEGERHNILRFSMHSGEIREHRGLCVCLSMIVIMICEC
jgi:hypothetical protein